jgi:hypothetical protein
MRMIAKGGAMAAIGYLLGESAILELPKTIGRLGGTVCLILDDIRRVVEDTSAARNHEHA